MLKWLVKRNQGVSMLGIILALGIYAIMSSAIVSLMLGSFAGIMRSEQWIEGNVLAQEGYEAVRSIRDRAWNELVLNESAIATNTEGWIFTGEGTIEQIGDFTRTITFSDICRDSSDSMAICPSEYLDVQSKKIDVKVVWPIAALGGNATSSAEYSSYLNNWEGPNWLQTDWSEGDGQSVWFNESKYLQDDTNFLITDVGEIKLYTAIEGGGWFPGGGFEYTDTSDLDFDAGTYSNTISIRSGDASSVILDEDYLWNRHSDSEIVTIEDINDIGVVSSNNVWAVSNNGGILKYDGSSWIEHSNKGASNLNAIEMLSSADGWAVGDVGSVYQYNGVSDTWTNTLDIPEVNDSLSVDFNQGSLTNVVVMNIDDGELVLDQFTGWQERSESAVVTTENINSISVVSATDIWGVGDGGDILHFNGSTWIKSQDMGGDDIFDIDMVSASEGWAVGQSSKFYYYNGVTWSVVNDLGNRIIYAVDMINANEGWAVGASGLIYYYNGVNWVEFDDTGNANIRDIEMIDSANGWAVADSGRVYYYDGVNWSLFTDTGATAWQQVNFTSVNNGWMVGASGKIWSYDGLVWSEVMDTGNNTWLGLHMLDVNNGVITDSGGQVGVWDGVTWNFNASPVNTALNQAYMTNSSNIWAVGDGGVIIQYGASYFENGIFESRIIDSGSVQSNWATVSWGENIPVDSSISVSVRAGDTATPDPSWSVWSNELVNSNGSSLSGVVGQYVQYRVSFDRGVNVSQTPEFLDIKITYNEPTSVNINDISIIDSNSYWVVGDTGFIAHYDGGSLVEYASPVVEDINSIDMIAEDEGWAVGDSGKILYYDGISWVEFADSGAMNWTKVSMITSVSGWLIGSSGLIYTYDGVSWTLYSDEGTMTWKDIHILSPTFGWVVGDGGEIYQFDGAIWSQVSSPTLTELNTIDVISTTEAWIGGVNGSLFNFGLNYYPSGTYLSKIFDGEEVDPGWDVIYWQENLPADSDITLSTRSGATPVPDPSWTGWSLEMTDELLSQVPTSQNDRYLQYRVTYSLGSASSTPELDYVTITYSGATSFALNDVAVVDETDVWAVGNTGKIAHYDGNGWSLFVELGGGNLNAVDAADVSNVWAVGQGGEIYKYNGVSWALFADTGGDTWNSIDMISTNDGWMVGNGGKIWHYDSVSWTEYDDLGNRDINDIFMNSVAEGWAVGDHGEIYYFDGVLWDIFEDIGSTNLYSIHMISPDDGWIVGASGKIYHFDGVSWSLESSPTGQDLNDVYMFDASDVLSVGNNGVILNWDGLTWGVIENPNSDDLYAIDMASTLEGWAVGFKGVVSLFRESANIVPPLGILISSAFQMGTSTYPVEVIEWDEDIPVDCSPIEACEIKFEIRVAPDDGGGPGVWTSWYGEDGPGTYFTERHGSLIPQELNWNSWMQYRFTMTSDQVVTPILKEVRINYKD